MYNRTAAVPLLRTHSSCSNFARESREWSCVHVDVAGGGDGDKTRRHEACSRFFVMSAVS